MGMFQQFKQLRETSNKGSQRLSLTAFLPSLRRKVRAAKGAPA